MPLAVGSTELHATLSVPEGAAGLVLFPHTGVDRYGPRSREVARILRRLGIATLVVDLERPDEEVRISRARAAQAVERLVGVIDAARCEPGLDHLALGLFAGGGAVAVALAAAAARPTSIVAIVGFDGHPVADGAVLAAVRSPTLFIVGEGDPAAVAASRDEARGLDALHRVDTLHAIAHVLDSPLTLAETARRAGDWLLPRFRCAARLYA